MSHQWPASGPLSQSRIELHTSEVDFIENRLPEYHQAFDSSKVRYNESQGQFVAIIPTSSQSLVVPSAFTHTGARPAPTCVADMQFWEDVFAVAMKRLNNGSKVNCKRDSKWDIRHLCKWDEIQTRLQEAKDDYDFKNSSKSFGKVRRTVRKVLDSQHVIPQQIGKVVPNSDIAGPIVGVINLMVDAYSKASEVRDGIICRMEDLPACFAKIDLYLRSFPKDDNVVKASTDLVLAVFEAVENSIKFYTSIQAKRATAAIFRGAQYQEDLVQSLASIKSSCDELESQATMSFRHRMICDNERFIGEISTLGQGNMMTHVGLSALLHGQQTQTARNWPPHSPSPSRSLTPQPVTLPVLTPRQVWSRLSIPNIDEEDLQHIADRAEEMFQQDRGRAQQIVTTSLFRSWIDSAHSIKLLVHGNFRSAGDVSPLSTLCTVLTIAFRQAGRFISLVFFCGRHLVWDEYHGGTVMIRSLIAQILRQFPSQYLNSDVYTLLQNMVDVEPLCDLFQFLVSQIPSRLPIVCIIDGINRYEAEEYLEDMTTVILRLVDLVDSSSSGNSTCFKLLITSPLPTSEVRQVFDVDRDAILHMENIPVTEPNMGFNGFQEQLVTRV
ncbi:hypothetical protein FSST1_009936 [Fusarium sambucinum]